MAVPSRVTTRKFCPLGVIEGQTDRPPRKPPYQRQAKDGCESPHQSKKLARLLTEYSMVISTGDREVGQTTLVEQSIPAKVGTRPSTSSEVPRKTTAATAICLQPVAPEYQIPRRTRASPAPDTSSQPADPPTSPPASLRASDIPLPEGESLGRRRWHTRTAPQIEVVEARTTIERLLERTQPSRSIPGLQARQAAALGTDADDLEDRARRVDATRRRSRLSPTEEDVLREKAAKLRTEATRFRHFVDLLTTN